jgi:Uma2 family endonuclease
VAASSVLMDSHEKREAYQQAGIPEYLLWQTKDAVLNWWALDHGAYRPLPREPDGSIRSRALPGLWLDADALLEENGARLLAKLHAGLQSAEHAEFGQELQKRRS